MTQRIYILVLALAIPSAVFGAGSLSGLVSSHGQPIPGATITVTQGDNKYQALTGDDGRYQLNGIETGAWQYTVEMFGFATASSEVKVGDGPVTLDVPLEMRSFDAPAAPVVVTENKTPAGPATPPAAGDNKKPETPAAAATRLQRRLPRRDSSTKAQQAANRRRPPAQNGTRRGPAGASGSYQNLSLTESADSQMMGNLGFRTRDACGGADPEPDTRPWSLNGSLSRGMDEARSDDSYLMRMGFGGMGPGGFGPGGPGGPGGPDGSGFGGGGPGGPGGGGAG